MGTPEETSDVLSIFNANKYLGMALIFSTGCFSVLPRRRLLTFSVMEHLISAGAAKLLYTCIFAGITIATIPFVVVEFLEERRRGRRKESRPTTTTTTTTTLSGAASYLQDDDDDPRQQQQQQQHQMRMMTTPKKAPSTATGGKEEGKKSSGRSSNRNNVLTYPL